MRCEISVHFTDGVYSSKGYVNFNCGDPESEEFIDLLLQNLVYALPKQDLPKFDVIEMFNDGKSIGRGENT